MVSKERKKRLKNQENYRKKIANQTAEEKEQVILNFVILKFFIIFEIIQYN